MGAWTFPAIGIAPGVGGTFLPKLSDGFARWHRGTLSIACYSACFRVLAPAMKVPPVGLVYAIGAGVGIVAAALLGFLVLGERLGPLALVFVAVIVVGAAGLRLMSPA